MRILFTFMGGNGHFEPLVPIARAARASGHTVAFGCGPSIASVVETAGFTVYVLGKAPATPPVRLPLRPLDSEREDEEFRERFARRGAQYRAPLTLNLCAQWQPDVLVCDETDFGGMVAAERLQLPYATVLVMAAGSFVRAETVGEALGELRARQGLPADPELVMLSRYLVLSSFPSGFRDPAYPLPATAHTFRLPIREAEGSTPEWSSVLPGAPTVYFTLGTIFNMESGDLFARVLAGLRQLPYNIIVTVGTYIDPAEFGPQPANIHIARYIPQSAVLPWCSAVISHGGSGSVLGALAYGLPSVLIPMGADQPLNANRSAELGLAQVLDPLEATPKSVCAAVVTVLEDPAYRQNAEAMRDEIAAFPGPEHAVALLERLAAEQKPVYST